jgi:3D-(3,5/4)-trihydroxycyclohexane-1,2-dione acylhydrolase (decyclizing)
MVHVEIDPLVHAPSSESWWDVPVSAGAGLDTTNAARQTYEAQKARQKPFLTPAN